MAINNSITLEADRRKYSDYFKWYKGDLESLWAKPGTLINGLKYVTVNDLLTTLNYFSSASKFYINGIMNDIPEPLEPFFKLVERMVTHWSVTGEYCLTIENGVINTIRPDYVYPIRKADNYDVIQGYYFIFPIPDSQDARVIEYNVVTGKAYQTIRTLFGNQLENKTGGTPVQIDHVIYENTGGGFYKDIEGMVRELNIRFALLQLALNSTAIPLLQIATEGIGGGILGPDGITPTKIAGLGQSGIGLVVPPPFTGEDGARYIERTGTGLDEAIAYIRIILGSLAVMSGVPEYVYGVSLTQSTAEVERVMFMGESRINRMRRAMQNTFAELGIQVEFNDDPIIISDRQVTENATTN